MATQAQPTDQHTHIPESDGDVSAIRLRFAQLKVQFNELQIKQPMPFIRWRRPEVTAEQVQRIRMALTGRAGSDDGDLAQLCEKVIEELKAA